MQTRRAFLASAVGACGVVALGGTAKAFAGEALLLRPPGGQDEGVLLGACIRCDRCRSACPQNIVVTAQLEDGIANARTPVLDFHRGYCDFCDKCIQACPTGALAPFDETQEHIGVAVVDANECLACTSSACRKCIDACPYGAICADEGGRPVVDAALCNGCGYCEFICPSASYGSYSGSRARGINVVVQHGEQ